MSADFGSSSSDAKIRYAENHMGSRPLDLLNATFRTELFRQVNPCQRGVGFNNCYACAAAMFCWIETGAVRPAVCVGPGQGLCLYPDQWTPGTLRHILHLVFRGGHGTHLILQGIRPPHSRFAADHACNLVNIDPPNGIRRPGHGSVHLVDAYVNRIIPDTAGPSFQDSLQQITDFCVTWNEMRSFSYRTRPYDVALIQSNERCPERHPPDHFGRYT